MTYYGRDLARVHHLGFGHRAALCAPGILSLLERSGKVAALSSNWVAGPAYSLGT